MYLVQRTYSFRSLGASFGIRNDSLSDSGHAPVTSVTPAFAVLILWTLQSAASPENSPNLILFLCYLHPSLSTPTWRIFSRTQFFNSATLLRWMTVSAGAEGLQVRDALKTWWWLRYKYSLLGWEEYPNLSTCMLWRSSLPWIYLVTVFSWIYSGTYTSASTFAICRIRRLITFHLCTLLLPRYSYNGPIARFTSARPSSASPDIL